jgi:hypothetical protein
MSSLHFMQKFFVYLFVKGKFQSHPLSILKGENQTCVKFTFEILQNKYLFFWERQVVFLHLSKRCNFPQRA